MRMDKAAFDAEVADAVATRSATPPEGVPANPIYLPAPHEVARALYTAFTTPPPRRTASGCMKACGTASRSSSGAS